MNPPILKDTETASAEMMLFLGDFSKLLDKHILKIRESLLTTVDQAMAGVMAINLAADSKLKAADEVLVKDQSKNFVSKKAKEIDSSFSDPAAKVKHVNDALAKHMEGLSNLDANVRGLLFSIMGGLSIDDVVRQRLEHVSTALDALRIGIEQVLMHYRSGALITEEFTHAIERDLMAKMYSVFTMEEEKKIFKKVFGSVSGINQKP